MSGGDGTENRLGRESSPYLQLHRHNPVDWYPWGDEALERARREDKPIFLSVGYSTCYWCHVMERESFASPDIAGLMNREFVNIKLDREERPDLDEIYMTATQVLTGHGGWPNSVFLNGRLEPFFAGTYFPPEDRHGLPSFTRVLTSLADAWKGRRGEIDEQAASVAGAVRRTLERRSAPTPTPPGPDLPRRSLVALERRFDARWGGFGGAPKFPTPANLFLLYELADEIPRAGEMLTATLDAMARGGICDQVGGGFHRYATDAEWKIPHFEKMLYDNGQLLELYALEWQRTGDAATGRVVRETAAFLERELTSPDGAFWSAMDAETDGEEGAFYVWTREELEEVLGAEDAAFLAPLLGFDQAPFFEGDRYVLHLPRRLDEQARARRVSEEALLGEIAPLRRRLLERRRERPELLIDEKILVDWNGMVIAGLATAARLLPEPELLDPAVRAAESLLRTARAKDGTLLHAVRDGAGSIQAFLSDYAFLSHGLLALHEATGDERWLRKVIELVEEQDRRLGDPLGGFFSAAEDDDLLVRSKELVDGAVPAANAMAVLNLLALAERTGEERWREMASRALRACAVIVEQQPEGARMMAVAVSRYHRQADSSTSVERTPLTEQAIEAVRIGWTRAPADDEGWRPIEVELEVAEGLHLQAHPASADYLVATTLIGEDVELDDLAYPVGHPLEDGFAEEPIDVYSGTVRISGKVRGDGRLFLIYQACSATGCLPPVRLPLGTPDEESGG